MSWHTSNNRGAVITSWNLIAKQSLLTWHELAMENSMPCIKTWRGTVLGSHLIRCMVRVCLMSRPWTLLQQREGRDYFNQLNNSWTALCAWRTSGVLHCMSLYGGEHLWAGGHHSCFWSSNAFSKVVCAICCLHYGKSLKADKWNTFLDSLQMLTGMWQLDLAIRAGW